eukprot:TRINITY_DN9101_c0_g1_i1.p1 TRINITY_DN9101_c0_g1~~TRINITY_DN9101_c0_g1_i1.p1  ORF type:complete len:377 (-),score=65.96 TRINITY_DN9101_c0_g1_i1:142-1272(-)
MAGSQSSSFGVILVVVFGALNCCSSALTITFNKYVLSSNRFPFVFALMISHCVVNSIMAALLFIAKPSWFTSLSGTNKMEINCRLLAKGALPIAVLFAAQLVLGNLALQVCSVSFLQMMKEMSPAVVFLFAVMMGSEQLDGRKVFLMIIVTVATGVTVRGEIAFSMSGFLMQALCIILTSLSVILQGKLLTSGSGQKLDPLSYILITLPLSGLTLTAAVAGIRYHGDVASVLPPLESLVSWWPVILVSAMIAFGHNIILCFFFRYSSALTVGLNAILKDTFIVACSCVALHESITQIQLIGFVIQLGALAAFSLMKLYPAEFEDGILRGIVRSLGRPQEEKKLLWATDSSTGGEGRATGGFQYKSFQPAQARADMP